MPVKVAEFLREYKALCDKYGMMVVSDGEPVQVGPKDNSYWEIEESTERYFRTAPPELEWTK